MFNALRAAQEPDELAEAERTISGDERGLTAYRAGKSCHPLLPYADWAGCAPALSRLGQVIVSGCRDAGRASSRVRAESRRGERARDGARGRRWPRPTRDPASAALRAVARGLTHPHAQHGGHQPNEHD